MTAAGQSAFAGSVPALYHARLGPLFFVPYARDLASRVSCSPNCAVLELACGTGILTEELLRRIDKTCALTATDLNDAMIDVARARIGSERVRWQTADALALPFADASFDVVACQFGIMFFPDKIAAAREVRRVLRRGGQFLFNVWGTIDENPIARMTFDAVAPFFPTGAPSFYKVPFSYNDRTQIAADLRAAGLDEIAVDTLDLTGSAASAEDAAIGLVQGSPLSQAVREHGTAPLDEVTRTVAAAIAQRLGATDLQVAMRAHVFAARA